MDSFKWLIRFDSYNICHIFWSPIIPSSSWLGFIPVRKIDVFEFDWNSQSQSSFRNNVQSLESRHGDLFSLEFDIYQVIYPYVPIEVFYIADQVDDSQTTLV